MTPILPERKLGAFNVSAIGFGCMSLSHGYGSPPPLAAAEALLQAALDRGVNHFDTAALYGAGVNEDLLGRVLKPHRAKVVLASKGGMTMRDGKRIIDGRPDALRQNCEASLKRLGTEVIDLYYLHRLDKNVPIEDSVGALAALVKDGKIKAIGLSEVSAATLRRAHAVHPITAMQTEYSLWTRNPEIAVLDACAALGVALVAFSPVARGYLSGKLRDPETLHAKDIRRGMPRFNSENYPANLALLDAYAAIAKDTHCSMAQLALAWLLAQSTCVLPLPGTTQTAHLIENLGALDVTLAADVLTRLDALINTRTVHGPRYNAATQADVDTEEF